MFRSGAATGASILLPVIDSLRRRVDRAVDRIVSGRRWRVKALIAVLAIALFRTFPDPRWRQMPSVEPLWRAAMYKVDHPLADMARFFPPFSHEAKLTFRLTVPIIAHVLHLRRAGLTVVFALASALLLNCVLSLTYAITGSRRAAFYMSLATACLWAGLSGFQETRGGMYDSVALCLLLLAMNTSSPVLTGIYAFAAAWTDERAFIALPMVLVFAIATPISRLTARRVFPGKPAAIVLAALAYGATREYLTVARSLIVATAAVGASVLVALPASDPLELFTALGGTWLMVVLGLIVLLAEKRYRMAAAFCGALVVIILAALSVVDRTRSLAYCLPAVFAGMSVLARSEPAENVEGIAMLCCLISFVVPLYYFEFNYLSGIDYTRVPYPLPYYVLRWAAHSLMGS